MVVCDDLLCSSFPTAVAELSYRRVLRTTCRYLS